MNCAVFHLSCAGDSIFDLGLVCLEFRSGFSTSCFLSSCCRFVSGFHSLHDIPQILAALDNHATHAETEKRREGCIHWGRSQRQVCFWIPFSTRHPTNSGSTGQPCHACRNRKEKRRLHPVGAQRKTQNRKMVLRHGGAPFVAESEVGRRKPHSDASRKPQSRHRRPRPGPGRSGKSFFQHLENVVVLGFSHLGFRVS